MPAPVVTRGEPITPFWCLSVGGCHGSFEDPPVSGGCPRCGGTLLQILVVVDELPPNHPTSPYARRRPSSPTTDPTNNEGDEA